MCLNGLDVGRDPVSFFLFVSPGFFAGADYFGIFGHTGFLLRGLYAFHGDWQDGYCWDNLQCHLSGSFGSACVWPIRDIMVLDERVACETLPHLNEVWTPREQSKKMLLSIFERSIPWFWLGLSSGLPSSKGIISHCKHPNQWDQWVWMSLVGFGHCSFGIFRSREALQIIQNNPNWWCASDFTHEYTQCCAILVPLTRDSARCPPVDFFLNEEYYTSVM